MFGADIRNVGRGTPPTPEEMRAFASRFTDDEWFLLSRQDGFADTVTKSIRAARPLAEKLIKKLKQKKLL